MNLIFLALGLGLSLNLQTASAAPPPPPAPPAPPASVYDDGPDEDGLADDRDMEDDDDGDPMDGDFDTIAEEIGATPEQRKKIEDAFYAAHQERIDLKAKKAKSGLELKRLLHAATLDEKAVGKATDALVSAESELRRNQIELMVQLRKVLTAEQWAELEKLRREGKRGERRGGGHGGGHGAKEGKAGKAGKMERQLLRAL